MQLGRVLGAIPTILVGILIPDNASTEKEWEVNGVHYEYNEDDFSLIITYPDGRQEHVTMYPDGTMVDEQGAILGTIDKNGNFEPITEQEERDYRIWKANGGDGSIAVWKNSGKPVEFESNPKHGKSKRGKANPEPTNPKKALGNSIELPGNTTRRIAVDKEAGEFVVFDEHLPGKFHGHIRKWEELDQTMQATLRKEGLVTKKGKIK